MSDLEKSAQNINEFLGFDEEFEKRLKLRYGPEATLENVKLTDEEFLDLALSGDHPDDEATRQNIPRNRSSDVCRGISYDFFRKYLRNPRRLLSHHLKNFDAFLANGLAPSVLGGKGIDRVFDPNDKDHKRLMKERTEELIRQQQFRYGDDLPTSTSRRSDDAAMEVEVTPVVVDDGSKTSDVDESVPMDDVDWILETGEDVEGAFEGEVIEKEVETPAAGEASSGKKTKPQHPFFTNSEKKKKSSGGTKADAKTLYEFLPDPVVASVRMTNLRVDPVTEKPGENAVRRCVLQETDYATRVWVDRVVAMRDCTLRSAQILLKWATYDVERLREYRESEAWATGRPLEPVTWEELIEEFSEDDETTSLVFQPSPEDPRRPRRPGERRYDIIRTFKNQSIGMMFAPVGCSLCPRRNDRRVMPSGFMIVNGKFKAILPQQDNAPLRFKVRLQKNANAPESAWNVVGSVTCRYRGDNAAIVVHSITVVRSATAKNPFWVRFHSTVNNELPLIYLLSALGAKGVEDIVRRVCRYELDPHKLDDLANMVREKLGRDPAHIPEAEKAGGVKDIWPDQFSSLRALGHTHIRKTGYQKKRVKMKRKDRVWNHEVEKTLLSEHPNFDSSAALASSSSVNVGGGGGVSGQVRGSGGMGGPTRSYSSASYDSASFGGPQSNAEIEVRRGEFCLEHHVFPWLKKDHKLKLETLCSYLYYVLKVARGDRPKDPKDDLGDKYCVTMYDFMTKIFNEWRQKNVDLRIKQQLGRIYSWPLKRGPLEADPSFVFCVTRPVDEIMKRRVSSGKYADGYAGVTVNVELLNRISFYSDMLRTVVRTKSANRKGDMVEMREPDPGRSPHTCMIRNPDGKNTGLVPFLTTFAQLSVASPPSDVVELIEKRTVLEFLRPDQRSLLRPWNQVEFHVSVEKLTCDPLPPLSSSSSGTLATHKPFSWTTSDPSREPSFGFASPAPPKTRRDRRIRVTCAGVMRGEDDRLYCLNAAGTALEPYRLKKYGYVFHVESHAPTRRSNYAHLPPQVLARVLSMAKRHGLIHEHVGIHFDHANNLLAVRTGMGRHIFAVLVGEYLKDFERVRRDASTLGWTQHEKRGHVVWMDSQEFHSHRVAVYLDDFYEGLGTDDPFDYALIHPSTALSLPANLPAKSNHNMAVRQSYVSSIINQAISACECDPRDLLQKSNVYLVHPSMPVLPTLTYRCLGMLERPNCVLAKVDIDHFEGLGIEDAVMLNRFVNDVGALDSVKCKILKFAETFDPETNRRKVLGKPRTYSVHNPRAVDYLDDRHFHALVGTRFNSRDVAIAATQMDIVVTNRVVNSCTGKASLNKMREDVLRRFREFRANSNHPDREYATFLAGYEDPILEERSSDASVRVHDFDNCVVSRVEVTERRHESYGVVLRTVSLFLSRLDDMAEADKLTTGHPLKAMVSKRVNYDRRPFDPHTGSVSSVTINPTSFSRNTRALEYECMAGIISTSTNMGIKDGTAFESRDALAEFETLLRQGGHRETGGKKLVSGLTGEFTREPICQGIITEHVLRHKVAGKVSVCSSGAICAKTRQQLPGRAVEGGGSLRFGEYEKDNLMSHGATMSWFQTRSRAASYHVPVCTGCGYIEGIRLLEDVEGGDEARAARLRSRSRRGRKDEPGPVVHDPDFTLRKYWCNICKEPVNPTRVVGPYVAYGVLRNMILGSSVVPRFEVEPLETATTRVC